MRLPKIILFSGLMAISLAISAQTDDSRQWPQFHGWQGKGILDGAGIPAEWDMSSGKNIRWKTDIPGLAHSSPVIWNDRVFVTTAVSASLQDSLKIGLYGDIDMADDRSVHQFKVYCLDRRSGKILWERIACEGVPKERRHTKSTYANPTPATDGSHLVVSFGSMGLYCYDFDGGLLWKKDLGNLATGPYNEEGVEWGYASSPVIHAGKVAVQCDLLKNSFLTLLNVGDGSEVWRVDRDVISSWSSPALYEGSGKTLVILNGYPSARAYDFNTGKEIWRIGETGDAPAPTPVVANNLIYLNSAHGYFSPIAAVRPDAEGDITLPKDSTSGKYVAWCLKRGGAYMASPLVYGNYLYNMQINGLLTCFDALTGKVAYKQSTTRAFSASGVASDGKLYFPAETGEVYVLQAGPEYKELAVNNLDDVCMSTPAVSPGMLIFRTRHSVIAVGEK